MLKIKMPQTTELFVRPSTIKNLRHNITRKLQIPSETHSLVKWVIDNKNLFDLE